MGRKRGKGKFSVYIGLRCDEETSKAMEKVARAKHGGELGDAYRAAFRAYAGLAQFAAKLKPQKVSVKKSTLRRWKDVRHSKPAKKVTKSEPKKTILSGLKKRKKS